MAQGPAFQRTFRDPNTPAHALNPPPAYSRYGRGTFVQGILTNPPGMPTPAMQPGTIADEMLNGSLAWTPYALGALSFYRPKIGIPISIGALAILFFFGNKRL